MDYAVSRLTTEVPRTFKDTHVKTLISCTFDNTISMSGLFRLFGNRLRDERWIVVLKSLSLIHLLTREGNSERILGFLCSNIDVLYQSFYHQHGPVSTKIIKSYSAYLERKVCTYRTLKYDWIRQQDEAVARFRSATDEVQLIRDSELVQKMIQAALECTWEIDSKTNIVIQQAFRFILAEDFNLFLLSNESIVRVLGLYFQMEKKNAIKALELYKIFVKQTQRLQEVFQLAKENLPMRVKIPNFNVPPVELVTKLEDYINDPDHEEKRLAAKHGKPVNSNDEQETDSFSLGKPSSSQIKKPSSNNISSNQANDKPLIDFFDSVEEHYITSLKTNATPAFSNEWDYQFSQQAAVQSSIQTQIQLTNQLLNSGKFDFAPNNFQTSNFAPQQPSTMFGAQNNGFSSLNSNAFNQQPMSNLVLSSANPFIETSNQNDHDPFTSLASSSNPTFGNPLTNKQGFNYGITGGAFSSAAASSNRFSDVPDNSFMSNTGANNFNFGGAGPMSFAPTMPNSPSTFSQSTSFSPNMPSNLPNNSSGMFNQQQPNSDSFVNPSLIHNSAPFSVNDNRFGLSNMRSSGNSTLPNYGGYGSNFAAPAPFLSNQMTGNSFNSNNNPFSEPGINFANNAPFGGSNSSLGLLPTVASNQQFSPQNQGTSLASQFHTANNNYTVGGGGNYTSSTIPRAVNADTLQQKRIDFHPNLMNGAMNGNLSQQQTDQQAQRVQGAAFSNNNHNPFF